MPFLSVIKVEILKLYHKRSTLLLLLLLLPPVLFGIGMTMGLSFFVSDGGNSGADAIGINLSGMGFVVNMLGQSNYILFLVTIILAATAFSAELENGQIKAELIRICSRSKVLAAKYVALLIVISSAFLVFILWSFVVYALFVSRTGYANGQLFDALYLTHLRYILFQWLAVAVAMSFAFLMGIKLKTFPCFAVSYIVWFASLYSDFIDKIRLFFPSNMPDYLLETNGHITALFPYTVLYTGYCALFILSAVLLFKRIDIKN